MTYTYLNRGSVISILTNAPPLEGSFRMHANKIIKEDKIVLWRQHEACIFTIIAHPDENRLHINYILTHFAKVLSDHFKNPHVTSQPKEILSKPDEILVLLHHFLPNGQCVYMSTPLMKQLKREIDSTILK